jgi:hypothetical protein
VEDRDDVEILERLLVLDHGHVLVEVEPLGEHHLAGLRRPGLREEERRRRDAGYGEPAYCPAPPRRTERPGPAVAGGQRHPGREPGPRLERRQRANQLVRLAQEGLVVEPSFAVPVVRHR